MLDNNCIFCKIIEGEIPSQKYYEDNNFLAIYDINPISEGHLVIFSKNHYKNISEMPEDEFKRICLKARELAEKQMKEIKSDGYHLLINQGEAAQSGVPHRPHIHIIPRRFGDGIKIDPR
ncbi:MAG TPA: HIT domain-containing protein [Candidatus Paceibacterota bacterium]|nr:HIT domain-containing protein [Candidatus Paceibacterota bacterium]HOK97187.1 HIT domain-containing protein [Candidatus Paceibacterota bacterium]HPP64622.1 HIT domain-containing protein [Candidatus Paceibacterota bacterium]